MSRASIKRKGERGYVGRAGRLVKIPVDPGMTILVPGDVHYPVQDRAAVDLLMRFASDIRPDITLYQGDTFDTASLSKHRRSAKQALDTGSLELEARAAKKDIARMVRYSDRVYVGPGNHEERVYAHVDDHPALHGMEWYTPFLPALEDCHLLPRRYVATLGLATVCHGHTLKGALNRHSAATVLSRNPGQSTFFGHTHRVDQTSNAVWKQGVPDEHMAASVGHLCDIDEVDYTEDDPWRLGAGVLKTFRLPDRRVGFTFVQHCILRTARGLVLHSPLNDRVYT